MEPKQSATLALVASAAGTLAVFAWAWAEGARPSVGPVLLGFGLGFVLAYGLLGVVGRRG